MNNQKDLSASELVAEDRVLTVRDVLRNAIIDRRLAPATKLTESDVGSLFGVSRTVARTGLQMLACEGVVRWNDTAGLSSQILCRSRRDKSLHHGG